MNRMNNQKGQALVEFALVLSFLLLLVLGITEFARAWYFDNALDVGVRAGVRYASELYPIPAKDYSRIQTYVQGEVHSYVNSIAATSVTVNVDPPTVASRLVTVRAQYVLTEPLLNTLDSIIYATSGQHISTSFTLQRTGTMYYELSTT